MRRVLLAGLVLVTGGLWLAPADEPKAPTPDSPQARKLAKIREKFEADEKELKKKLDAAKDADDKQQVNFLIKEAHAFAASDAVELAEENKKDEAGLDAALFALKLLGKYPITGADMDKATTILLEHHVDNPKIGPALGYLVDAGRTGQLFLEAVQEKALNKEVQALALYYNGLAKDHRISAAEGPDTDEVKVAKARAEAADMMERAARMAPDAKVGDTTLAKAVEAELVSMKIGVGNAVPEIEGADLDGKKVKLSGYKGKVLLLDFWATWCGPCRGMIPHERELVEKQKGKPFALVSVSADEDKAALTDFLKTDKMPWDHWWDGSKGPVVKMFKVRAFPTLYLIDAKGVVRKKWVGSPGNEAIDKAVEELVAEAQKK
jgi:thiol-disulfide isomerase/thioredoxin